MSAIRNQHQQKNSRHPYRLVPLTLVVLACIAVGTMMTAARAVSASGGASISGTVSCEGECGSAAIVVIALEQEHVKRYRFLETETPVYAASEVAGYARIRGSGPYVIDRLPEGSYSVFAWQDNNGNGGIEHHNYAEPIGWYQSPDHLGPIRLDVRGDARNIDIRLITPHAYPTGKPWVQRGGGGGRLRQVRGFTVLNLFGSPEERAYAQGYLAGPQIMDFLEFVIIENFAGSAKWYEEEFIPFLTAKFSSHRQYDGEVEALLAGMRDAGTDMRIRWLDRSVSAADIYAINSFYFLEVFRGIPPQGDRPDGSRVSCSSAVAWGGMTQNPELEGGVIHGKNMDGENDLRKVTVNSLMIVAIDPGPESGLKRTVSVDWPGFIGTFNPMNEDGVYLAPHAVSSVPDFGASDLIDYPLKYRPVIMKASSTDEVLDIWHRTGGTLSAGFNTSISQPAATKSVYPPSVTLESDAYGYSLRLPGTPWPENSEMIFTINAFFAYEGVNKEALAPLRSYHEEVEPWDYRYRDMAERALGYIGERGSIGTEEMIGIMQAASTSKEYQGQTEYSFIAYPDKREFALAREDLERKILDAPFARYERFTFDELFEQGCP